MPLKYASVLLFFISFYLLLSEMYISLLKNKYQKTAKEYRFPFLSEAIRERLNRKLERLEYPFGLNADRYMVYKILILPLSTLYTLNFQMQFVQAVIFITGLFFAPDIYLYFKEKEMREAVRREILTVVDIFEAGTAVDIDYGELVYLASKAVKTKWLSKKLEKISAEYHVTKDNKRFYASIKNIADLPELISLSNILEQKDITGRAKEMLSNLSYTLYSYQLSQAMTKNKTSDYKVLFASFLIAVGVFAVYFATLFPDAMLGIRVLFH
ncbi:hypothetical protein SAMN04244560_00319 [Thermoanaerobacter thermohydrosulfuricus]|uniref:Flp pilus assembly protein TadB n=1 Tax=Thermoanaerobacter thermohydrosulfuricus TaxID=1516 RepID=A0A1G7ISF7_THETY|nr:hypothetical protein SAMN04244560_00319 [Thermoanaerobacter thermohydrosulfuricus]